MRLAIRITRQKEIDGTTTYMIVDGRGNTVGDEGRHYATRRAAEIAINTMYGHYADWDLRRTTRGWSIKIDVPYIGNR